MAAAVTKIQVIIADMRKEADEWLHHPTHCGIYGLLNKYAQKIEAIISSKEAK